MAETGLRLLWSPEAESDLLDIWRWGARFFSQDVADSHLRDIDRAARNLLKFPESGRSRDELRLGLRAIVVFPTVVFYRVTRTTIEVVRVVDGRRNISAMFADGTDKN
jgi:toxin ParE1/3/4